MVAFKYALCLVETMKENTNPEEQITFEMEKIQGKTAMTATATVILFS